MQHGLVVTRVHKALQFRARRVFEHLTKEVTHHRSEADRDPNKKILAELFKLLGNSYYGKCLTDQQKHMNVQYMNEDDAVAAVNTSLFKKLDIVGESGSCPFFVHTNGSQFVPKRNIFQTPTKCQWPRKKSS